MGTGTLYLIPTTLGESSLDSVLPAQVQHIAASLEHFVAENPKTARQFFKLLPLGMPLQEIEIGTLDQHTTPEQIETLLQPALSGKDMGLVSEAGCPAVADPGAQLVRLAHARNVRVVPLVGPSSILLALMASGMNGQAFAFHGYLPISKDERIRKIGELEQESRTRNQTQVFIEAPYRNQQLLEDLVHHANLDTDLCLATDITLPTEQIETKPVSEWKKGLPDIQKRPTIFLLYRRPGPRQGRATSRRK
jgi:16S rRNA (cytidine1402-2'-O)-methyltransferase